jgi:hypothetical protein
MVKRSRAERAQRDAEREATARIQAAWQASVPPATAKEFAARTMPNPPRPGHEPKPAKEPNRQRRRRY